MFMEIVQTMIWSPGTEEGRKSPGDTVAAHHTGHAGVEEGGREGGGVLLDLGSQTSLSILFWASTHPGLQQPLGKFLCGAVRPLKPASEYLELLGQVEG